MYLLKSTARGARYYLGSTGDVPARLVDHNTAFALTRESIVPWQLHLRIEFSDEEHALKKLGLPASFRL